MNDTKERTTKANSLLRGEISAVETYEQAITKIEDPKIMADLTRISSEHREAVVSLRSVVVDEGGEPSEGSGPWGSWAQLVTGTAKILGPQTTLKALREGEQHGVKEFQEALEDESLPLTLRQQIRTTYLPRQERHLQTLEGLIQRLA